jgi:hypothetical protein
MADRCSTVVVSCNPAPSIAAKDGREESIHVRLEPFLHSLSCHWIGTLKAVESLREVFDDGCGLDKNAFALD